MNKTIAHILLLSLTLQWVTPLVSAAAPASIEERTAVLAELTRSFEKVCLGPDGEILKDVGVVDSSMVGNSAEPLLCEEEAARLGQALLDLEQETNYTPDQTGGVNHSCANCNLPPEAEVTAVSSIPPQVAGALAAINANSCPAGQSENSLASTQCIQAAACNAVQSFGLPAILLEKVVSSAAEGDKPKLCGNSHNGNCFTELLAGVLKGLWSNVTALWDLAKLTAEGASGLAKSAGRAVVSGWNAIWGIEDKTSEAMLAAAQQSPSQIDLFKAHPIQFMKDMATKLGEMFWSFTQESFGCKRWEGLPHASKCAEPMDSWKCASCDQKWNVICGLGGLVGAEVIAFYLTGGVASVGKGVVKTTVEVTAKVAEILKAVRPIAAVVGKIVEGGGAIARVGIRISETAAKAAKAVTETAVAIKLTRFAKTGATVFGRPFTQAAATTSGKITIRIVKGVTTFNPVSLYIKLLGKAFKLGVKHMDRALGAAELAGKAAKARIIGRAAEGAAKAGESDAATAARIARHAEQLENTKNFHFILNDDPAGLKAEAMLKDVEKNLEAGNVKFKEVETPEGGKAVDVELPGTECPGGKLTLSLGAKK